MKETYGTLSETINGLKQDGYTLDFNVEENSIVYSGVSHKLSPEEFVIDKVYRFEGETNPSDQSILYALSSQKNNIKGILVNGYGISADTEVDELITKLNTHPEQKNQK
jgi:hypothetical protein